MKFYNSTGPNLRVVRMFMQEKGVTLPMEEVDLRCAVVKTAGDRYSLADLFLYCMVDFAGGVGQPWDPALTHLTAWFERVAQRPSAAAGK